MKQEIKHSNTSRLKQVTKDFSGFMKPYFCFCLNSAKITEDKNPKVARTKNLGIKLLSKWTVCDSEKSKYIYEQEPSRLLNSKQFRNKEMGHSNSFRWSSFVVKVLDNLIQIIK